MNSVNFDSIYDLADCMLFDLDIATDDKISVGCIGKYETIKRLISAIIVSSGDELHLIDASLEYKNEHCDEYILTIDHEGIWVQKMKYKNCEMYVDVNPTFCYVEGDIPAIILDYIESDCIVTEFAFKKQECNGDCANCPNFEEESVDLDNELYPDDELNGFTYSIAKDDGISTYSFYSSDEEQVEKARKEILQKFR